MKSVRVAFLALLMASALARCKSADPVLATFPNPLAKDPDSWSDPSDVRAQVGGFFDLAVSMTPQDNVLRYNLLLTRISDDSEAHATLRRYGYLTLNELLPYAEELIKAGGSLAGQNGRQPLSDAPFVQTQTNVTLAGWQEEEQPLSAFPLVLPQSEFTFADNLLAVRFAATPIGRALLTERDWSEMSRNGLVGEETDVARKEALLGKALSAQRATIELQRALASADQPQSAARHWERAFSLMRQSPEGAAMLWQLHMLRALAAVDRHDLRSAAADLRQAVAKIETTRMEVRVPEIRQRTFASKLVAYGLLIECLVDSNLPAEAEHYAGLAKARTLQDVPVPRSPQPSGRTERARRHRAAEDILAAEKELDQSGQAMPGVADAASLFERTSDAWFRYQQLRTELQQDFYAAPTVTGRSPVSGGTTALPPSWVALDYFLAAGRIHLWIVGSEGLLAYRNHAIEYDAAAALVAQFRHTIYYRGDSEEEAGKLYDLLIAPAEPYIAGRNLIIVPHQILHFLPFEALRHDGRYLVEDHVVAYAPALNLATFSASDERERSFLGLADSQSFPFAPAEVKAARQAFLQGEVLLDTEASKEALIREAARFDVLHIATHVEVSNRYPLLTHVQLASGALYLFEIPDLRLRAHLVVLSGCRTSIGALDSGDEIAALGRALLANGAAAVVVSLWKVDDQSTSQFMELFYSRLKQDGVAGALAFAKRQMIHGRYDLDASGEPIAFPHPYFWSGLIAAGNVQ